MKLKWTHFLFSLQNNSSNCSCVSSQATFSPFYLKLLPFSLINKTIRRYHLAINLEKGKTFATNNLRLFKVHIEKVRNRFFLSVKKSSQFISHLDDNATYAVILIKFHSFGMCLIVRDFRSKWLENHANIFHH